MEAVPLSAATFSRTSRLRCSAVAVLALFGIQTVSAYSVLSHEAIVDSAWDISLKPAILTRFPGTTPDQLIEAHAYAYGGSIIQDMGYYPFSSKLFSDLVHYFRSGDFVMALLKDAKDADGYAFALGALAHYSSDITGHPIAINRAVPMLFPKLRRKYGDEMTYEDNTAAHLKTEFGFDVLEVARGRYAPKAYHDFIGFQVSKPLLEQAFEETYGVPLKSVIKDLGLALGTYRSAVGGLIPEMTRVAWDQKKDQIAQASPGMTRQRYVYNLSRASYQKEWGKDYHQPGVGARLLAFLFRIIPRVGPFKALAFRVPTPEAEKLFMQSFNETLTRYKTFIAESLSNKLDIRDLNLDNGKPSGRATISYQTNPYQTCLRGWPSGTNPFGLTSGQPSCPTTPSRTRDCRRKPQPS